MIVVPGLVGLWSEGSVVWLSGGDVPVFGASVISWFSDLVGMFLCLVVLWSGGSVVQ